MSPFDKANRGLDPLALSGIAAVAWTRFLFRSHLLYDLDSVNFALGMLHFDPATHQPHPPGYFLYICLARLVNHVVPDPNAALVAISIGASCGAAWMIYLLSRAWFGVTPARISIVLFLFSPLCWFHGTVALTYIIEAFFAGLIGFLSWRVYEGRAAFAIPAAVAYGVAAGFRPSSALLLGPLWLFPVFRQRGRVRWLALLTACGVIGLWFVPMIQAAGGLRHYLDAFWRLWARVPGARTTLSSGWLVVARVLTIGFVLALTFGSASILAFFPRRHDVGAAKYRGFILLWIAPALVFFSLVFFNYVNSGYVLLVSPPFFAILAARLAAVGGSLQQRRWCFRTLVAAGIGANCAIFLWAPLYCSYRGVSAFEQQAAAIVKDIRGSATPEGTVILSFDSHFLGYRHAGYYLPEFQVIQYPEVSYPGGDRVFTLHHRQTRLTRQLSIGSARQFIIFPLPAGPDYSWYLEGVVAKLPKGAIRTLSAGNRTLLVGSVSLLPLLFPSAADDNIGGATQLMHVQNDRDSVGGHAERGPSGTSSR